MPADDAAVAATNRWRALALIAFCQVTALALWFSATAILPSLARDYDLSATQQSLFTSGVQAGFVVGTLISAFFGLADRLDPRRFFAASALVAALANAALLLVEPTSWGVIALRFATGMCMAGIYPVGMKLASTWAKNDMGLVVGLLVGALTLGSAAPHLFNALGGLDWRVTLMTASISALTAAVAILFVRLGPRMAATPRFDPRMVLAAWRVRSLRLANFGYFGHMWELYAMWAWIGVFLQASFLETMAPPDAALLARYATFAVVGIGALGCVAAGLLADRLGRTTITIAAMAVSGACALTVGFLFGGDPRWLIALCLVWGIAVVADSAQFSASIAELSERHLVGTMLTLQTSIGFTLTLLTIHLMPCGSTRLAGTTPLHRWRSARFSVSSRWRGCAPIRIRESSRAGGVRARLRYSQPLPSFARASGGRVAAASAIASSSAA
ncbi:MAG: MFS transporter [Rhodospirillaceae bacterium]|nr:MFS transporter [Rhodospirillaceae bacterium]